MSIIKYAIVDYWKEIGHEESRDLILFNSGMTIPLVITILTCYLTRLAAKQPKNYDLRPIRIVFYAIFFGVFGAGLALGYYILDRFSIFFMCNPPPLHGLIHAIKPILSMLEKRQKLNYVHFCCHLACNALFFFVGIVHPSEVNALALVSEVFCLMIYSAMQILDASSIEVRYETMKIRQWFLIIYRLGRFLSGLILIYHANFNISGKCACYPSIARIEYSFGFIITAMSIVDIIMKNDCFDLPDPPKQKTQ